MDFCKSTIIKLFNCGRLTLTSAEWYAQRGYRFVLADDRKTLIDILEE